MESTAAKKTVRLAGMESTAAKKRVKFTPQAFLLHAMLIFGAFIMTMPFIWMFLSSLKDIAQIFLIPPRWIPHPFIWTNFEKSWNFLPFSKAYFNSFYINVIVVIAQIITCSMAAYAFAKVKFPLREPIFVLF